MQYKLQIPKGKKLIFKVKYDEIYAFCPFVPFLYVNNTNYWYLKYHSFDTK